MLAYRPSTRTCSTRETGKPSSQCKSHDAGAQLRTSTRPTVLNKADPGGLLRSAHAAIIPSLWRSSRHTVSTLYRCSPRWCWHISNPNRHDAPRPDADGWCGTKLIHLKISRLQCSGASSRAAIMKDYELASETSPQASRCTSKRTWRSANKHADCSTKHTPFACTEFFFGPRNVEDRTMIKEAIKCKSQERLWKWEDQPSRFKTCIQEKRRPILRVRGRGGDLRTSQRNTVQQSVPPCSTVHQLCSLPRIQQLPLSMPRMQQLPAYAKNATTTSNSSATASNTSISSTTGERIGMNTCIVPNVWSKIRLLCMAETIRTKFF